VKRATPPVGLMGQGLGHKLTVCGCAEDCGQFQPWSDGKAGVGSVETPLGAISAASGYTGLDGNPGISYPEEGAYTVSAGRDDEAYEAQHEGTYQIPPVPSSPELSREAKAKGRTVAEAQEAKISNAEIIKFNVELAKNGDTSYGLAHVPMEDGTNTLLIVEFRDSGPIGRWNETQVAEGKPNNQIQAGDRIVAVGGSSDLQSMRASLRQDTVTFTVERWPSHIQVALHKKTAADKFGMQTDLIRKGLESKENPGEWSDVLCVGQIPGGGLLEQWNQWAILSRQFHQVVPPGSEILRVNDLEGNAERMQDLLVESRSVHILFRRPSPDAYK